jgi:hypothetical protein
VLEIALRKAVVYATTGVFFLVAATAQLQGASIAETFLKAGIACATMTVVGVVALRIVAEGLHWPSTEAQEADKAAAEAKASGSAGAASTALEKAA